MGYGRNSQESRGRSLRRLIINYTREQSESLKKRIGHIGRTRLWPIGIAVRVNANKISADGCARYVAIAEVLSL